MATQHIQRQIGYNFDLRLLKVYMEQFGKGEHVHKAKGLIGMLNSDYDGAYSAAKFLIEIGIAKSVRHNTQAGCELYTLHLLDATEQPTIFKL